MKAWRIFFTLLIAAPVSVFAQSRGDVRIYIPVITAEDPAQADFFRKNFTMEITAAGYTVSESIQEADYTLRMAVKRNMNISEDGTAEPASPDDRQYMLQINLMRNSDTAQIVALSFGFNELEEMYNHNLSLVYQTLANVPLGSGDGKTLVKYMVEKDDEREDWWRNKWLYLRMSVDYPISYYQIKSAGLYDGAFIFEGDDEDEDPALYSRITSQTVAMPGATVGLEVQVLSWMSLEANFELRLWDIAGFTFIPGIGVQLKFPFKPSTLFMLEPYAAAVFALSNPEHTIASPRFSFGGGMQFGVKGGNVGAFFFDVNYMYFPGEVVTRNLDDQFTQPEALRWNRFVIGLSAGFKIGVIDRVSKRAENSTWLFNDY
jgi:hypothetical protein